MYQQTLNVVPKPCDPCWQFGSFLEHPVERIAARLREYQGMHLLQELAELRLFAAYMNGGQR